MTTVTSAEKKSLFDCVWEELTRAKDPSSLIFPKKILWLNGAPGAGKGTHTSLILKTFGISENPIVISDLLQTPEARKLMDAGVLVGDEEVTTLLFQALLQPRYSEGVVIDGYPRTIAQAQCVQALFDQLGKLHDQHSARCPRPHFEVLVLMVDESTSVSRQLHRGQQALANNSAVKSTGQGQLQDVRATDLDPERALKRYRIFCESTFLALKSLESAFSYREIDANGSVEAVKNQLER